MRTKVNGRVTAERLQGGRFFRLMLREVRPEHVPSMLRILWLFGHGGRKLLVPAEGRWLMDLPHGYVLLGEGRTGVRIEPSRGQLAPRAQNPYIEPFDEGQPAVPVPKLDEHDTDAIVSLCERARKLASPERDQLIRQIFAIRQDRCRPKALDAIELLLYGLIVDEAA